MKIDRLLSIVIILLNREKVSANELADKFEVSVRTIYRDIETINAAGIPIVSYSGNTGGFSIMKNYKVSHQLLNVEDMISIVSALKGISNIIDNSNVDMAIEKIKNIIPRDKKEKFDKHLQRVVIDNSPWWNIRSSGESEKYNIIYESMLNKSNLRFGYINTKGEENVRNVEPITLVFKGSNWYLFAYCLLKNDYRVFKLIRMNNLGMLSSNTSDNRMTYEEYNKKQFSKNNPIKVSLKFSKDIKHLIEESYEAECITLDETGDIIVDTVFYEKNTIYSMVLSYGEKVEVLEPKYIRDKIKEKLQKAIDLYSNLT